MKIQWSVRGLYQALGLCAVVMAAAVCIGGPWSRVAVVTVAPPQGWTTAVQKANGAGIVVQYRIENGAAAQQPLTVTVVFSAVTDPGATVRFTTDAGLQLTGAAIPSVSLPLGMSELVLQATPQREGLFYLNIFTTQAGTTSVTSVPIQTSHVTPQLIQVGEAKVSGRGDRIIAISVP